MKGFSLKQLTLSLAIITIAAAGCTVKKASQLVIENAGIDKTDELIVVKRTELESKVDSLTAGKYVLLQDGGRPLVIQYDDLDGDGNWDEIAFLLSLKAGEKKALTFSVSDAPATIKAMVRAHVRHKRKNADSNIFGDDLSTDSIPPGQPATDFSKDAYPPFLTEGPAWENDKVGFRIYFDVRNGKDIWGKTTPRMVLDEVGNDTANNYHAKADWGMDILKVGKSLGAGSLALSLKGADGKDTLVRLGNQNMGTVSYKKIADGPVRAVFRLQYPAWKVLDNAAPVALTEEISIWGGQYFYESKVTLTGAPAGAKLVTGIVNLHSHASKNIDTAGYKALYTYDAQSENNDNLGMALVVPAKDFNSFFTTPNENTDVQNTYGIAFNSSNQPVQFRFYAGWQPSDLQFADEAAFAQFLTKEIERSSKPVTISWQ
jgi:hypothetical protein